MLKYFTDECHISLYVKEIPKLLETNPFFLIKYYFQINETFPVFILHSWHLIKFGILRYVV